MKNTIIYKVRRNDGLFSTGGTAPSFNKTGKVWNTIGALKNHLNLLDKSGACHYLNCEIVPIQVTYKEKTPVPMMDFIRERQRAEDEKRQEREEASRREKEQRELAELARLKAVYGDRAL